MIEIATVWKEIQTLKSDFDKLHADIAAKNAIELATDIAKDVADIVRVGSELHALYSSLKSLISK